MAGPDITGDPKPDTWTTDVARAGTSLYWAMYYADPSFIINAPDSVARAYMRCQDVMGPDPAARAARKAPEATMGED